MDPHPKAPGGIPQHHGLLSTVCVVQSALDQVIEDDCQFANGFSEELLQQRLSNVPSDWEIVFLGGQDLIAKMRHHSAKHSRRGS